MNRRGMTAQIEGAVAVLCGRALWACRRAADMATFQFGERRNTTDYFGRPSTGGEYALHVQCPWRIIRDDEIVVGSADLYYPEELQNDGKEVPADFDWYRSPNRRDKLLRSLFEDGKRSFVVQKVEAGIQGSLRILLSDDLSLEVLPVDSLSHERWRLFRPGTDEPHLVVTGRGVEM